VVGDRRSRNGSPCMPERLLPRQETYHTQSGQSSSTAYSNYALDINNSAKYQIIHDEYDGGNVHPMQRPQQSSQVNGNENGNTVNALKLEVNNEDLKHSLMSHHSHNESMGGAGAEYLKHSLSQVDPNQFTMKSTE